MVSTPRSNNEIFTLQDCEQKLRMAEDELSDLLQNVGDKLGWFDESGDISTAMENVS